MEVCKRFYADVTRVEMLGEWDDVRGSAIDNGEVGSLMASLTARMTMELQKGAPTGKQEQGNSELQMMVGTECVGPRTSPHTILTKERAGSPLKSEVILNSRLMRDICLTLRQSGLAQQQSLAWEGTCLTSKGGHMAQGCR